MSAEQINSHHAEVQVPAIGSQWNLAAYPGLVVTIEGVVRPDSEDSRYPADAGKAYAREPDNGSLRLIDLNDFAPGGPVTPVPRQAV